MTRDHFSIQQITPLASLRPGAKIHVIGVAGVAMAQLAVALAGRGFQVTGSDKEFYEPMGTFLRSSPVKLLAGYKAENVPSDVDLVVIGNVVSYGHPEVAVVEEKNVPYSMFPSVLRELVIAEHHSIVVAGTHGKTTTSSLIATILNGAGLQPAYFIGGAVPQLPLSLSVGQGSWSVVEGDEYDSCFFAKVSKFHFYAAQTLLVTSVEFDHSDIYADLTAVNRTFDTGVRAVPASGAVVVGLSGANINTLVEKWRKEIRARLITYGDSPLADYQILSHRLSDSGSSAVVRVPGGKTVEIQISLPGLHNLWNATGALAALDVAGVPRAKVLEQLPKFRGTKRRQEVVAEKGGITVIDDFAHHPTAVKETVAALVARYPRRRLIAVFEPRSNTSRKKIFQQEYVRAFTGCGAVYLCAPALREGESGADLMDVAELAHEITDRGIPVQIAQSAEIIFEKLSADLKTGDVVVIMSNGSFGEMVAKVTKLVSRSAD